MRFYAWIAVVLGAVSYTSAFSPLLNAKVTQRRLSLASTSTSLNTSTTTVHVEEGAVLGDIFPALSEPLERLGFATPTPIQQASAARSLENENLLLIAPTGSGKTLAYLLPALSKAMKEDGTVLVVAPTRELAAQLMRDSLSLLENLTEDPEGAVALSVRGVALPTPEELARALILIGTPSELLTTLTSVEDGYNFVGGDTLSAVILDEVDVLLPLPPKTLRTSLDEGGAKGKDKRKKQRNTPQDERRRQEQKRKLMSAKRKDAAINDEKQLVSPTEKLLNLVATCRFVGDDASTAPPQVLAGSATASRKTLDRLNRALRSSAEEASSSFEAVWANSMKPCRPEEEEGKSQEGADHTIRSVTVPSQVKHKYISLTKDSASSANVVLASVAKAVTAMKPNTALVFLCGEFGKSNTKAAAIARPKPTGATSKSRRNSMRRQKQLATTAAKTVTAPKTKALSARKVCSTLGEYGIEAKPLHVALGLELNAKPEDDNVEDPPVLVTFEGSARGLHFDGVDAVYVVGRPASAASYLHLAGRVGRSSADDGSVVIRPGTIVSLCTVGSAKELEKWTKQVGGNGLEELVL